MIKGNLSFDFLNMGMDLNCGFTLGYKRLYVQR